MAETTLAEIKVELSHIKKDTETIMKGIYGNGTKGLKAKVVELEVKFWIIVILLLPVVGWMIKGIFKCGG